MAIVVALPSWPVRAQQSTAQTVGAVFNWYYASAFGTGEYTADGQRVTVPAVPVTRTLREPSEQHWGVRLTLPVSVALANLDMTEPDPGDIENVDIAALSLLPGAELRMAIAENWRVHPFANVGRGRELQNDVAATVYQLGLSTLYEVPYWRWPQTAFGAKAMYAGYRVSGTDTTPIGPVSIGVSTLFPPGRKLGETHHSNIGAQLIATCHVTDLEFLAGDVTAREVHQGCGAALAFGLRPAVELFATRFELIGLSYVVGKNGLRGVRLVTDFPF